MRLRKSYTDLMANPVFLPVFQSSSYSIHFGGIMLEILGIGIVADAFCCSLTEHAVNKHSKTIEDCFPTFVAQGGK